MRTVTDQINIQVSTRRALDGRLEAAVRDLKELATE